MRLRARLRLARIRWRQHWCEHNHVYTRKWLINRDGSPCVLTRYICKDCGHQGPFYPRHTTAFQYDLYKLLETAKALPTNSKVEVID